MELYDDGEANPHEDRLKRGKLPLKLRRRLKKVVQARSRDIRYIRLHEEKGRGEPPEEANEDVHRSF